MALASTDRGLHAQVDRVLTDRRDGTVVLIDFDGTLFHRCSTEEFLDCARPAPLAATLLALVDGVAPWRLPARLRRRAAGPDHRRRAELAWRDWLRVMLVTLLFPWTPWLFRRRRVALAEAHANRPLVEAVRAYPGLRPVVVSHGFRPVVVPLVRAMGLDWPVLAAPLATAPRARWRGKAAAARRVLGARALSEAVVITDTPDDDADLMAATDAALVVTPAPGWLRPAHATAYRPFAYTSEAKHPGARHVIPTDRSHDTLAHSRFAMDVIRVGAATRSFQASQQASTISS